MSEWIKSEMGPECYCGNPTIVHVAEDGRAMLMCFFHTYEAGASFALPKGGRPDGWPNLPYEEIKALVERGEAEAKDQ